MAEVEHVDPDLLDRLQKVAVTKADGHFTIMRTMAIWRVAFSIPANRDDIAAMPSGRSFSEAATKALAGMEPPMAPRETEKI